jgi:N-acetylglutamate synthase-like GNAT family acetyltransferase
LKGPEAKLLSIARINYQFKVMVNEKEYDIGELVGLVSLEILKGHGKLLLSNIANNLAGRQIEAIGFCEKRNTAFYESAGFKVLLDKVKHLRERKDDQWFTPSEDDHIVAIALNDQTLQVFEQISDENPAYLYF